MKYYDVIVSRTQYVTVYVSAENTSEAEDIAISTIKGGVYENLFETDEYTYKYTTYEWDKDRSEEFETIMAESEDQ